MQRFFAEILGREFTIRQVEANLETEVARRGDDTNWCRQLIAARNLLIHQTAPWLALEAINWEAGARRFEPVLLTRNVRTLDDPKTFIHIAQCRSIYRGFEQSFDYIEAWLTDEIGSFEAHADGGHS
jgi:hypothetical protein